MIKINLLPQSKIKKSEHPEIIALAQIVLFLVIVFFGAQYFVKTLKLGTVRNDLKVAKAEHSKYQAIINELNSIKAVTAELETKKNLINDLIASRSVYPIFMEDLLAHLPRSMWISTLATQLGPDKTVSFTMAATALDIYTIADFVKVFESSEVMRKSEIGGIAQSGAVDSPVYTFSMKAEHKASTSAYTAQ